MESGKRNMNTKTSPQDAHTISKLLHMSISPVTCATVKSSQRDYDDSHLEEHHFLGSPWINVLECNRCNRGRDETTPHYVGFAGKRIELFETE